MRIRGALAATTTALACALASTGASAYDGEQNRMRAGAGAGGAPTQSADQPYDASYAHQWEANPPKGFPTLAPENIRATRAAIGRYTEIAQRGGWPMLRETLLQPGSSGPAVEALRQRLIISGDLKSAGGSGNGGYFPNPIVYDAAVEKAVKRFQASNGLTPTGIVDQRTLAALNIPAQVRLRQLEVNLARLEELSRGTPKRYVIVNIPAAQIEAVEGDRVVSRHAGVVGKIDRQTPLLKSAILELNFNPVWHLPPTVITKDLVPKGRDMQAQGKDVLAKYHIEAFAADGKKLDTAKINWSNLAVSNLTYRQQPGPENPLGFVKINFNNAYSVYMHDSPSQSLFGRNFRAASSGCVRVSGIEQLAAWLVREQGWGEDRVQQMKRSGERLDVRLKTPVPLYFAYITAWATEDGVVQFRRDIYKKDGVGDIASSY